MAWGWMMDQTQGGRAPALWVEGEPERSWLVGTKLGSKAVYVTETLRCDACGALRLYARQRKR